MRSLILAFALAATARAVAVKTRTAPRDAAAAFFHNPAATVLHETEAFEAAALPTARVGAAPRDDGLGHKPPIPRHPTRSPYAGENPVPLFNVSYLRLEPRREPHRRLGRV